MRFLFLTEALAFTSLATAHLIPRQAPASVYKGSGWIEFLVVRSNGDLLVNHLDKPEIWSLDSTTKAATKLATFANATSTTGITEYAPDQFAVVTGSFNITNISYTQGSWGVWKVDLSGATPKTTLVKEVPESNFWIGITPFNNDTVFIADAGKGAIYKMTLSTGNYSMILQDPTMIAPSGSLITEGIHGIVYNNGYVYYSNTFGNGFYKVKIDATTGKTIGAPIAVVPSMSNPEGFTFGPDGSAYVCSVGNKNIAKITPSGNMTTITDASGCSSVAFGRTAKDKSTLYISTSTGAVLSTTIS
ncbi:uncharacterized protein LY89DRAFT_722619 [Mollisia scopiformis]|uniref:SMP-30/Gluconolactonase/LRE-like region domain-containing protein n=1 Tax=Mollisia scopiformis TaxID=149040 RepID=A0A194WUX4_MOLSC|nr:uncharacterized protein LY89DRAFT_722619 [Mollisia scopiformis]KUJ11464.1 hypothetical protein LY89DRAFT_722619 [Mollisia scopiformis]